LVGMANAALACLLVLNPPYSQGDNH